MTSSSWQHQPWRSVQGFQKITKPACLILASFLVNLDHLGSCEPLPMAGHPTTDHFQCCHPGFVINVADAGTNWPLPPLAWMWGHPRAQRTGNPLIYSPWALPVPLPFQSALLALAPEKHSKGTFLCFIDVHLPRVCISCGINANSFSRWGKSFLPNFLNLLIM